MTHTQRHLIAIVFIGTLLLTACQSTPTSAPSPEAPSIPGRCAPVDAAAVEEIRIGAVAPLSPPGAAGAGKIMQTAFEIAAEEVNIGGGILGKPLRLIVRDTQGDPEQGKQAAEALITEDCVVAIVGEYHSAVGLEIMEIAHQYQTPVIFAETYSDDITASGYPEVFRIAPASTFTAQMDAKWLAEVGDYNGDGNLLSVIIAENTDYGTGQVAKAETWFPEFGLTLQVFYTDVPTDDFSAVIDKVAALEPAPDAVLVKVTGEPSYALQNQLIEAGVGPRNDTILVANQVALDHEAYWANVPNGDYVVVPRVGPWASAVTMKGEKFATEYQNAHGRWPEPYAFEAYDAVLLIADAINRAETLAPQPIIAALEATDIELASGRYTFPYNAANPVGDYVPEFMWHQWPSVPLLFLQYTEIGQHSDAMTVVWPEIYRTVDTAIARPAE